MRRSMMSKFITDPATGKVYPIPSGGSDDPPPDDPPADPPSTDGPPADPPKDEPLGEPGMKALEAERAARKEAEKKAKRAEELEAELAQLRQDSMSEQERAIEQARQEAAEAARNAVLSEVREERLNARVEAAATGKFADPKDAAAFLDLSDLDPDDTEAIAAEIDRVLEAKPYLKASSTPPPGSADQGARTPAPANVEPGMSRLRHAYSKTSK